MGDAVYEKQKKVVGFAVGKAVTIDNFGGEMAEVGGNETDGEFVVLFKNIGVFHKTKSSENNQVRLGFDKRRPVSVGVS